MADGFEIASAFVSVYPKIGAGFKKTLADATDGKAVGKSSGSGFASTFKAILAGSLVTKAIGAVGGLLKGAFAGGVSRALNIEEAQAKLAGLGHSTQAVDAIMKDALASVKGTAFGMGDAAAVAASAVAAGIAPGEALQRTLKLVGDAATIAGTDMGSMGSIFNKVAASNKMQMDVVNQLQDQGIPILQMVAQELGVTTEEAAKMASSGKVNFEIFQKAMEKGLGGAAQKSGETFRGALANMKAALSRVVADFAGPALDGLKAVFLAITPVIDSVGTALKPVSGWFADFISVNFVPFVAGLSGAKDAADGMTGPLGRVASIAISVRDALGSVAEGFGGMDSVLETLKGILPLVTGPLGILKSTLMEMFSGGGGNDFAGFGRTLGEAIKPVAETLAQLGSTVTSTLAETLSSLLPVALQLGAAFGGLAGELLSSLAPVLSQLVTSLLPVLGQLFASVVPVISQLVATIAPLVTQLIGQLAPVVTQIVTALLPPLISIFQTVVTAVMAIVSAVAPLISVLIGALMPIITTIVSTVLPPLVEVFTQIANLIVTLVVPVVTGLVQVLAAVLVPVIQMLAPIIQAVFGVIAAVISTVMGVVSGVIKVVTGAIRGDWSQVWEGIKQVFSSVWNGITSILTTAVTFVKNVVTTGFNLVKSTVTTIFTSVVSFIATIPSRIVSGLAGLGQLGAKAAQWVGGFLTTARNKFNEAVTFARSIPGRFVSALGNLGGRLLQAGKDLIQGFINGVKNMAGNIASAAKSVVDGAVNAAKSALGIQSPSRVFLQIGTQTGEGLRIGLDQAQSTVAKAGARLAAAAVPDAPIIPLAEMTPGIEGTISAILSGESDRDDRLVALLESMLRTLLAELRRTTPTIRTATVLA